MYVPCTNSKVFSMVMADSRKESRHNKQVKQTTYERAMKIRKNYPHLRNIAVGYLMWAIQRLGYPQVEEAAAMNKSIFTFKQAVHRLNQGESPNRLALAS